jgi:hypothetical protein
MVTAIAVVAPLTLSTVQHRYPRLFRQYASLSVSELGGQGKFKPHSTDPITGLYTTINFQDFTEKIRADPVDIPLKTESSGNKYYHFVHRMLRACETGDRGIDAGRLLQILEAALEGALQYSNSSPELSFQHMLGWVMAAHNHGLDNLFKGGEPIEHVFELAAQEWKKLFMGTVVSGSIPGVSDELRKYAIKLCESFRNNLLKHHRTVRGKRAKYSFNFINPGDVQPTKKAKTDVDVDPTEAKDYSDTPRHVCIHSGVFVNADDVMAATIAARTAIANDHNSSIASTVIVRLGGKVKEGMGFYNNESVVSITVKKRKNVKLGLVLVKVAGPANCSAMKVTTIRESSLFHNTGLLAGMIIFLVNRTIYTDFDHGLELLQSAKGDVTIVAAFPRQNESIGGNNSDADVRAIKEESVAVDATSDAPIEEQTALTIGTI